MADHETDVFSQIVFSAEKVGKPVKLLAIAGNDPARALLEAAIALQAMNPGNDLTATLTDNRGYVTSPSQAISQQVSAGATLNVTENGNTIRVRP